ncbi:hypothetical protein [Polymorphospora sp. NPDC050346]|uniref:hypothetical protein n=1 Tax=Polymorphospora sp. NPDC050346 TaxID=3155780 RepID=UPI0033C5970E
MRLKPAPVMAAAVALLLAATPAVAHAKPQPSVTTQMTTQAAPAGFASWAEVYELQTRLNAAAERILRAGDAGNPSIVADPLRRELLVHWKGTVPPAVLAEAATAGVPVRFRPARHTLRELTAEARRIVGDERVAEAAPDADGGGLTVTVTGTTLEAGQRDLLSTARVAVTVRTGARPQATGRQADSPLFWGGSAYTIGSNQCSTGFTVKRAGQPLPSRLMLSAGHCTRPSGGTVVVPGLPNPAGSVEAGSTHGCRDTTLLHLPGGAAGVVYTGAWNSTAGAIVGLDTGVTAGFDLVNNLVTTSGAGTGMHSNLLVEAVNVFARVNGARCADAVGPLIRARATAGCAVGPGDSGGPVFAGPSFQGRGIIVSSGAPDSDGDRAQCPSAAPSGYPILGTRTVLYAPLLRPTGDPMIGALQHYDVTLVP